MDRIERLNDYDTDEIERWLIDRLEKQYSEDEKTRYRASDYRSFGVSLGETHLSALQAVFRQLTADAQQRFGAALENAMRHVVVARFPARAMADLIALVGRTRSYSATAAFAPIVGAGPWGREHPELVYDALSVILTFGRSNEAYVAAKALATSSNFFNHFAMDAYLVLVRSRPEQWFEDWQLLKERIIEFVYSVQRSTDATASATFARLERRFFRTLADSIPLSVFETELRNLTPGPTQTAAENPDTWLMRGLFVGHDAPLVLQRGHRFVLRRSRDSSPAVPIKTSDRFEIGCRALNIGVPVYLEKKRAAGMRLGLLKIIRNTQRPVPRQPISSRTSPSKVTGPVSRD